MRLIDADALKLTVRQKLHLTCDTTCKVIDEAPTVDAIPVVRCKDCRRVRGFGGVGIEPDEVGICTVTEMCVAPDDFCSYGERRTDGET